MIANFAFSLMLPMCCLYAALRGGAPERIVAAAFIVAAVATAFTGTGLPSREGTRWGVFAVDTLLLIALIATALRAHRIWILPTCSLQLLTVLAHCVNALLPGIGPWPYAASIMWTSLLMPPLLAFGTYCHRRRLALDGRDRSWRS